MPTVSLGACLDSRAPGCFSLEVLILKLPLDGGGSVTRVRGCFNMAAIETKSDDESGWSTGGMEMSLTKIGKSGERP